MNKSHQYSLLVSYRFSAVSHSQSALLQQYNHTQHTSKNWRESERIDMEPNSCFNNAIRTAARMACEAVPVYVHRMLL